MEKQISSRNYITFGNSRLCLLLLFARRKREVREKRTQLMSPEIAIKEFDVPSFHYDCKRMSGNTIDCYITPQYNSSIRNRSRYKANCSRPRVREYRWRQKDERNYGFTASLIFHFGERFTAFGIEWIRKERKEERSRDEERKRDSLTRYSFYSCCKKMHSTMPPPSSSLESGLWVRVFVAATFARAKKKEQSRNKGYAVKTCQRDGAVASRVSVVPRGIFRVLSRIDGFNNSLSQCLTPPVRRNRGIVRQSARARKISAQNPSDFDKISGALIQRARS